MKRGKVIKAIYISKAPGGILLSNGTKASFNEMDEESLAHFDPKVRTKFLSRYATIQEHASTTSFPFEYFAAQKLLARGYIPDYRAVKYLTTNGKYEPISIQTWISAKSFIAILEAEFLPEHIQNFIKQYANMRYDDELQEFAYPKLWELRTILKNRIVLAAQKIQEESKMAPLYATILKADKGDAEAMLFLYREYLSGGQLGQSNALALDYLRRASKTGHIKVKYALAECLRQGTLIEKDIGQAIKIYTELAELQESLAMLLLADIYSNTNEGYLDIDKSLKMCEKAMILGDANGVPFLTTRANSGIAKFSLALGKYYRAGTFVSQSNQKAVTWFTLASEQGDLEAKTILGHAYHFGELGVRKNLPLALKYYEKLRETGDAEALSACKEIRQEIKQEEEERERLAREAEKLREQKEAERKRRAAEAKRIAKERKARNAGKYNYRISSILSDFGHQNVMADNIFQQITNGTYRTVELLEIIACEMECPSTAVSDIMSGFKHNNIMADNVNQQILNGTYRTVELLLLIARKKGCSANAIDGILSDFKHQNIMADNIFQQITNGTYRTVELLEIIACEIECSSTAVSDIMSDFKHNNTMADNVNQQILNGTYRTVDLLMLIAAKEGCAPSNLDDIKSDFRHNNTMADNILQQIMNGTYRTVELLALIASELN